MRLRVTVYDTDPRVRRTNGTMTKAVDIDAEVYGPIAMKNHYQTLERLESRGGVDVFEFMAIHMKKPYAEIEDVDYSECVKHFEEYAASNPAKE